MPSKDSPVRTRLSGSERRAQISRAAEELARRQGLDAVTLRAVAAEVGVGSALVAHHAPSMDEVVADAFEAIVAAELADLERLRDAHADPVALVRELLGTLLDGSRSDVTLIWVQSWALGGRNDTLAARVRAQMDAWTDFLEDIVRRGTAAGRFRVEDAGAVAAQLLGMIDGLNAHALVSWRDAAGRIALMSTALEAMLGLDAGDLSR
ncbi:TetR/AcrR family transcriptional regulator [Microbacterium imperiale]|uniref:TetR family transcriptional regulator n=1 Tax=Microbacterium imperiale TaxID=33884 RepID=A0A9W6HHF4_9MICO|nr:TetR family transcriptional regulator C-terminal domain-containing protein [Microbacterium imperiale]MBP2421280.1 AcrR family transcriptional regulator [Microbacterium imperiale]MDS0199610.1 TetR family transcriptional regulator C-terminal domain-containing protein [Microbacterium imperiale]BFE41619.1 TetR/AcrR family transcriptional regulator [Microbacterium imperiale]GLJ80570.1 TetR family transcriptional regulator [Microbacterium imperiale]